MKDWRIIVGPIVLVLAIILLIAVSCEVDLGSKKSSRSDKKDEKITCPVCHGSGTDSDPDVYFCRRCHGLGWVTK